MTPGGEHESNEGQSILAAGHCRCGRGHGAGRRREEARREHIGPGLTGCDDSAVSLLARRSRASCRFGSPAPRPRCDAASSSTSSASSSRRASRRGTSPRSCRPSAHADVAVERPGLPHHRGGRSPARPRWPRGPRPSPVGRCPLCRPSLRLRRPSPRSVQDSLLRSWRARPLLQAPRAWPLSPSAAQPRRRRCRDGRDRARDAPRRHRRRPRPPTRVVEARALGRAKKSASRGSTAPRFSDQTWSVGTSRRRSHLRMAHACASSKSGWST